MDQRLKRSFLRQYIIGWLFIFISAPLVLLAIKIAGYTVRDLKKNRAAILNLFKKHKGPWIICANHLTMIDSVILAHAMLPLHRYLFHYHLVPWNVPEKMNFQRNPIVAFICYLLKCIPVQRGGDRGTVKSTLDKCSYLLEKKENLMIFPEGTRSRNGHIDTKEFSYGVGRLFINNPDCQVMCIYLRGDGQETYSNFPRRNETFSMKVKMYQPEIRLKGLRAQRDCARQIITCLAQMEKSYFETCGK